MIFPKKVAVIIPAYNMEMYIARTIRSVQRQTYKNLEIIIIDDGSVDGTADTVHSMKQNDDKIVLIKKANGGVSSARNAGLDYLNGNNFDFFCFIDGDDVILKSYITDMVKFFEDDSIDIVSSFVKETSSIDDITDLGGLEFRQNLHSRDAIDELLYDKSIKNHSCGKMYRASTLGLYRFDEKLSVGEDMKYVFYTILDSRKVCILDGSSYFYIRREGSAMNSEFSKKRADSFKAALDIHLKCLEVNDESIVKASEVKLFTESLSIFSKINKAQYRDANLKAKCRHEMIKFRLSTLKNRRANSGQRLYALLALIDPILSSYAANMKIYLSEIKERH